MPRPGDTSPGGMSTGMMGASPSGMTGRHDRLNSSTHSISASSFSAAAKKEQIARLRQRREFLARVDLLSRQNAAAGKPPVAPSPRGTPRDSIGGTLRDEDKPSGVDAGTETEVPESRPESAQTDELDLISRKTQTEPVFEKTAKHTDEDYEGLEKRLEEAENDASEKRKRNEESEALLADMTGKLRAAEEDRDRMRIEMQEMERAEPDQSMFEEREQELSDSLRNAEQTIFRLRAEVRELKAQKNALNFELDHLKSSPLSPRSVSSDSPRSPRAPDYPDLRSELEVEKNKSSGLAQELQQLRQEVVALRNERTELTENLSREQQRSEQADKALEDAKSRSAAQEQEIAEKSQKLAEMEKINADRPPLPPSSTVTVRTPEPPEASLPAPAPTVASESLETSSLLAAPRKPSNFSSDSCEVADEGITDDVRTAEVSNEDTLKKHSSEAKLAAASKSAEASPIAGQKPDVAGRQTPPDDFWGDAAASPVTGHGISNTGNAAVFAISTPDADSSHPKNAQGSSVSFSPVTAGGKEGRSDSIKSGAKQNKGTADAGDTSFTRRATGVATLFEDDEISTAAIFGGNANGEALDFDSILNSEPSSPFPGWERPRTTFAAATWWQQCTGIRRSISSEQRILECCEFARKLGKEQQFVELC
ncbi:hypothetical protein FOL47_011329 [Perkinsus chesapeaki]|uniref:Uncharacterized protein n=1 Tax=Perkinsus chesapeaki TaxID=330153 RepID=A0A7J6MML1_PERCH|nr:hypothetical protein FOL47_011329 [Perkinsus chesapeaki]